MKTGLKLISLMFCLGFCSLPAKSLCPAGEVPCPIGDGVCATSINQCPGRLSAGNYSLPPGTTFYCESGKKPSELPASPNSGENTHSYSCSSTTSSLSESTPSKYDFKSGVVYSFGEGVTFKCSSPPEKVTKPSPTNGVPKEYWVCPKNTSEKTK